MKLISTDKNSDDLKQLISRKREIQKNLLNKSLTLSNLEDLSSSDVFKKRIELEQVDGGISINLALIVIDRINEFPLSQNEIESGFKKAVELLNDYQSATLI